MRNSQSDQLSNLSPDKVEGHSDTTTNIEDDDLWADVNAGLFGDGMKFLFSEGAEDADVEEERNRALRTVAVEMSKSRRGRMGTGTTAADDFEDETEKAVFLHLYNRVRDSFVAGVPKEKREHSLEWVLGLEYDDPLSGAGLTFDLCCAALEIRPWIIRARLHFQFYLKQMVFADAMPFLTSGIPEVIRSEAMYFGGDVGLSVVARLWQHPGMPNNELAPDVTIGHVVNALESKGLIGEAGGLWYFTGRNPTGLRGSRATTSWLSLW